MSNKEKLIDIFVATFGLTPEEAEHAVFKNTPAWDSVGHVNLMNASEEGFDISIDPDDILDFKSFEIGVKILEKYE